MHEEGGTRNINIRRRRCREQHPLLPLRQLRFSKSLRCPRRSSPHHTIYAPPQTSICGTVKVTSLILMSSHRPVFSGWRWPGRTYLFDCRLQRAFLFTATSLSSVAAFSSKAGYLWRHVVTASASSDHAPSFATSITWFSNHKTSSSILSPVTRDVTRLPRDRPRPANSSALIFFFFSRFPLVLAGAASGPRPTKHARRNQFFHGVVFMPVALSLLPGGGKGGRPSSPAPRSSGRSSSSYPRKSAGGDGGKPGAGGLDGGLRGSKARKVGSEISAHKAFRPTYLQSC